MYLQNELGSGEEKINPDREGNHRRRINIVTLRSAIKQQVGMETGGKTSPAEPRPVEATNSGLEPEEGVPVGLNIL
jgi:hypothetical protein